MLLFLFLMWFLPAVAIPLPTTTNLAEIYFDNLNSLQANFIQRDASEVEQRGEILILKPGMIRLDYYSPNPITLLIKGHMLTYYDREIDEYNYSVISSALYSLLSIKNLKDLDGIILLKEEDNLKYVKFFFKEIKSDSIIEVIFHKDEKTISEFNITSSEELTNFKFYNIIYNKNIDKSKFNITNSIGEDD